MKTLTYKPAAKFRSVKKRAFLVAYAKCGLMMRACAIVDIHHSTYQDWLKNDKVFRQCFLEAKEWHIQQLEATADERATKLKGPSDTLLIFRLKALRPEVYRERHEMHMKITDSELDAEIEEELAKRSAALSAVHPSSNGHS